MILEVELLNEIDTVDIPHLSKFKTWVNQAINIAQPLLPNTCHSICISIIDKVHSAELNKTYRDKTGSTNILSFSYQTIPGFAQESLGDLAICAELVKEEAIEQQKSIELHWAHLTIHGVLHLLGYDHESDVDAEVMESLENIILQKLE